MVDFGGKPAPVLCRLDVPDRKSTRLGEYAIAEQLETDPLLHSNQTECDPGCSKTYSWPQEMWHSIVSRRCSSEEALGVLGRSDGMAPDGSGLRGDSSGLLDCLTKTGFHSGMRWL
jgi:hypothetical protein